MEFLNKFFVTWWFLMVMVVVGDSYVGHVMGNGSTEVGSGC